MSVPTEIRIAPEISGHLARYLVEPGGTVQPGQVAAVLDNPELWAAVGVARAQGNRVRSDRDRVYAGPREEQVQELQREVQKAQAVHAQAVQELGRVSVLAKRSDSSLEALDEAKAEAARNAADIDVAEARYEAALHGPTAEERELADATLAASEAARDVVEARASKMLLRAPVAGTIAIEAAEPGEAVVPGEPVLTMVPEQGTWFGFNLREDQLRDLGDRGSRPDTLKRQCRGGRRKAGRAAKPGRICCVAGGARHRRSRPQYVLSAPGSGRRNGRDAGSDGVAGSLMEPVPLYGWPA